MRLLSTLLLCLLPAIVQAQVGAYGNKVEVINNVSTTSVVTQSDTVKTRITGVDYTAGRSGIDSSTEVLTMITYPHHEVHAGNHFYAEFDTTLGSSDSLFFVLTTADTTRWVHILGRITGTFITKIRLYEKPDINTGLGNNDTDKQQP